MKQIQTHVIATVVVEVDSLDFLIVQTPEHQVIYVINNGSAEEILRLAFQTRIKIVPTRIDGATCIIVSNETNANQFQIHCLALSRSDTELKLMATEIDSVQTLPIRSLVSSGENVIFLSTADVVNVLRYDSVSKQVKRQKKVIHGAFDITAKRFDDSRKHFIAIPTKLNGKYFVEIYM